MSPTGLNYAITAWLFRSSEGEAFEAIERDMQVRLSGGHVVDP